MASPCGHVTEVSVYGHLLFSLRTGRYIVYTRTTLHPRGGFYINAKSSCQCLRGRGRGGILAARLMAWYTCFICSAWSILLFFRLQVYGFDGRRLCLDRVAVMTVSAV